MAGLEDLMQPQWLQSGMQQAPPNGPGQGLLDPFNPPRVRGIGESIAGLLPQFDEKGMYKAPSLGGALQMLMMAFGRTPGGARVSNPVVPMRPFKPNTSSAIDPMSAANMNPPKNMRWTNTDDGIGPPGNGFSFATDAQGKNMAGVPAQWNGERFIYQPRIQAPARGATTDAHVGPEFNSREIAQQYAEQLLRGGKFGPKPDPSFAAPFVEQDALALRQLMADKARQNFRTVE